MGKFTYTATGYRRHPERCGFQRLRITRSDEQELELAIELAQQHGYVFHHRIRLGRRVEASS